MKREKQLLALLTDADTAALLTAEPSVRYYAGREATSGTAILVWQEGCALLPSCTAMREDGFRALKAALPGSISRLLTEPDALTCTEALALRQAMPFPVDFSLTLQERVYLQRREKTPEELIKLRQAQDITDRAFADLLGLVREGMTDREVQKLIADLLWRHGSEMTQFNHVIGCGSATVDPHVRPSGRILTRGDLLMVDIGALVDGYGSDMTRMIALGKPDEKKRLIFDVVLAAQSAGIAAAKVGAICSEVDGAARAVIEEAGYGAFFPHGLGHPVGCGGREGPRFNRSDRTVLHGNVVMTVEPGVYLPGEFGIRMEDMLLITAAGSEDLTHTPRELFVI